MKVKFEMEFANDITLSELDDISKDLIHLVSDKYQYAIKECGVTIERKGGVKE